MVLTHKIIGRLLLAHFSPILLSRAVAFWTLKGTKKRETSFEKFPQMPQTKPFEWLPIERLFIAFGLFFAVFFYVFVLPAWRQNWLIYAFKGA